jgi:5-methylcytosine-specific restriction endonuclease McrA
MFQHVDPICSCEGKCCPACNQWKCHLAFYKNPKGVNGLFAKCKECVKLAEKAHRARKKEQLGKPIEIPKFQHIDPICDCDGKFCRTCAQWKCYLAFSKDHKGGKGLSSACKECIKSYQLAHRDEINEQRRKNRQENAEHYSAYMKEFHRKNPEPKKARNRKYRQEHAEQIRVYLSVYGRTNEAYRAKRRAHRREYSRLHPEQNAQNFNNRRARLQQVGGSLTSREWKKLCKHYNYTCLCCKKQVPEIKLTVDHVIPLCKGGANSIENIQPLCQSCNSKKHRNIIDLSGL